MLTAVGLLPIAAAGIDIAAMMKGAADARECCKEGTLDTNPAYKYAALRNILYRKGKNIEILVNYEPALMMTGEWFKQLFAESEGKDNKGIFPAACDFTTDLHSLGQFIQDGTRMMFETVMNVETPRTELVIGQESTDLDGLNYLAGRTVDFVNKSAMKGVIVAHTDGNVPNLMVNIPEQNEF